MTTETARWLLLIHRLPPKPDYLRVKVRRRLQRLGAVALKNSVYALPATDQAREDFQWLLREVLAEGGDALLCDAALLGGVTDADVRALFARDRNAAYAEIAAASAQATAPHEIARLRRRLAEVVAIDHVGADGRAAAEGALASAEAKVRPVASAATSERPTGRTWVTRADVHVDRIASAWLVRRFIDPAARFKFVPRDEYATGYTPAANEIRFDMFEAEYTHEGARCTFETLLDRFALEDAGLAALGEIVHDIDMKESTFGRPETAGVVAMIDGIVERTADDETRIERAGALLDALHAALSTQSVATDDA